MTSARAGFRAAIGLFVVLCSSFAFGAQDPAAVFAKKCSGCHTFGHGDRVGPDLKGVTDRRSRAWLLSWIRSSQRLVTERDRTALTLFEKFKRERMPDQPLSEQEIGALLDYVAAGGPLTATTGRARHAETAAAAEIALGRDIHRVLVLEIRRPVGDYEFFGWSVPSGDVGGDLVDLIETGAGWLG